MCNFPLHFYGVDQKDTAVAPLLRKEDETICRGGDDRSLVWSTPQRRRLDPRFTMRIWSRAQQITPEVALNGRSR